MKTDIKKFPGKFHDQVKKIATIWEGAHVKITNKEHPWYGEVGHVLRIDYMAWLPALVVELDNGIECAVFSGKELKKI